MNSFFEIFVGTALAVGGVPDATTCPVDFVQIIEANTDTVKIDTTPARASPMGTSMPSSPSNIFTPIKANTTASPTLKYSNFCLTCASTKNSELMPKTANTY